MPTFTFGQIIPTTIKAEPSAGQLQGAFTGQPKSSSHFVTPSSLLGNIPSSKQSGFGSDLTFHHTPLQQTRDDNPNSPPPPFPPLSGTSSSPAAPQNIFMTTTWKPKDPPCFYGKSAQTMRMHGLPWCVLILFFWLVLHNKRLHMQPHSYVVLHRSGGLAICGGIMRSTPMIRIL